MLKKIRKFIKDPKIRFSYISRSGLLNWLSDSRYLRMKYYIEFHKKLNLDSPKTFNEKMQWLKLHDRKKIYTTMADKYEAKKYIASIIGEKYIIPTIGIYKQFDDINFKKLPNQFVIKCTHDSSGPIIVKNKNNFDKDAAKRKINRALKRKYYYSCREWPYKNIEPRIIVEKFIQDDVTDDLRDYKFMCFNGIPKYVYITIKNNDIFENYYDMNFNPVDINHGFPRSNINFKKPELFEEMKAVAAKLSRGTAFLRVDLHYTNGKILFGEITFYDWAGFRPFNSPELDEKLGDLINLDNPGVK